jgi:lipopolysaccharide export system ATP-binding protein
MATEDTYLIRTEKLVKAYKGRKVVRDVDINVKAGEIVGLLGPNGAGKTTSFYMIVGLVKPTAGKVFFNGKDVTKMPMFKRARMGMGYLSQEPSIFRKLTVQDNIMAILETLPLSKKERNERLELLLDDLKITKLAKQKAFTLSGGERRRLEIARSLVSQPDIILLDEPFAGVDPLAVNDVQEIVKTLKSRGLGVLITDHSVRDTLEVVDRAYLLCEGQVLREGNSEFLVNDEMSRELYLGPRFSM